MKNRWVPDKNKVENIRRYLKYILLNPLDPPSDDFITDCAKLTIFLMDESAIKTQLNKLEQELKLRLSTHETNPEGKLVIKKGTVKILRTLLETELAKFGFHPEFGVSLDILNPDDFLMAISNGLMLKDIAFRKHPHGEFTHAIQWLLIAWQNQEEPFLSKNVSTVFKTFGEKNTKTRCYNRLWDIVVDKVPIEKTKNDFRSPEYLDELIKDNQEDFNILRQLLIYRANKDIPRNLEKKSKYVEVKPGLFEPKKIQQPNPELTMFVQLVNTERDKLFKTELSPLQKESITHLAYLTVKSEHPNLKFSYEDYKKQNSEFNLSQNKGMK